MVEITYLRARDQCEVMVDYDDAGRVESVYAWRDRVPDIPGVTWAGDGTLFVYASDPEAARRYLEEHFDR